MCSRDSAAPGRWLTIAAVMLGAACAEREVDTTTGGLAGETWVRTFGTDLSDEALDIIADPNGGYLIACTAGGSPTSDDMRDHQLVRLDPTGEVVGTSALVDQDARGDYAAVVQLDNGRVMTFGTTTLTANGGGSRRSVWSSSGELVDTVQYTEGPLWVTQAITDGVSATFITSGDGIGNGSFMVVRLDADGEVEWSRAFGPGLGAGQSIASFSNGDLLVCSIGGEDQTFLARVALSSEVVWAVDTPPSDFHACMTVVVDANDRVFAGGYRLDGPAGGTDMTIASFDPDGTWRWSKAWGTPVNDVIVDVAVDDDGIVAAGWTGLSQGDRDGLLARFSFDGELVWAKAIGGPGPQPEELHAVDIDSEGWIAAVGFADRTAGGREHLWVRTTASGELAQDCDSSAPLELVETVDETSSFVLITADWVDRVLGEDRTPTSTSARGVAQDECGGQDAGPDADEAEGTLYSCAIGVRGPDGGLLLALLAISAVLAPRWGRRRP